jgi:dihydroxyacetone kinase-like protein
MLTLETVNNWLSKLADVYAENKDLLTELDSAIGDADHGINMARGFGAVKEGIGGEEGINAAFKKTSMTLIKTVGGASGPLYGTFFMKSAAALPAGAEVSISDLAAAFKVGLEGLQKMGKSITGEKTMVYAWTPALAALDKAIAEGLSDKQAMERAVTAAEVGVKSTIDMLATKGRASYLAERSIGHQDPGATSTWLMLKTLALVM